MLTFASGLSLLKLAMILSHVFSQRVGLAMTSDLAQITPSSCIYKCDFQNIYKLLVLNGF